MALAHQIVDGAALASQVTRKRRGRHGWKREAGCCVCLMSATLCERLPVCSGKPHSVAHADQKTTLRGVDRKRQERIQRKRDRK